MNRDELDATLERAAEQAQHLIFGRYFPHLENPPQLYALKEGGRLVAGIVTSDPSSAKRIARSRGLEGVIEPVRPRGDVTVYDGVCLLRDVGVDVHWPGERGVCKEVWRLHDEAYRREEEDWARRSRASREALNYPG